MIQDSHGEPIRAWFERKTKKVRKAILWSSLVAVVGSPVAFMCMSDKAIATLQVFNGAITIPVSAAIWFAAFIFMFLLPSREAGFRSQEGIDEAKAMLAKAIDEKVGPAMDALRSVAGKVDKYLEDGVVDKVSSAVEDARKAVHERIVPAADCMNRVCQRLEASIVNAKLLDEVREAASAMGALCRKYEKAGTPDATQITKFMDESKPVLAMLQRVQKRFEKDFTEEFVSDLKDAIRSARELGGMAAPKGVPKKPAVPVMTKSDIPPAFLPVAVKAVQSVPKVDPREPNMDRALEVIRRKKVSEVKA